MLRLLNKARSRLGRAVAAIARPQMPESLNPRNFQPILPVPQGFTKEQILDALCTLTINGSVKGELRGYATADCERFLYTVDLVPERSGQLLEIGGNPYFTTLLLRRFRRDYHLHITNFFGGPAGKHKQSLRFSGFDGAIEEFDVEYHSLNIEQWAFPFADDSMDVVVFGEVLEHLTNDPMHAMREIWRVLKTDGVLVLTTPNAARIENVVAFLEGRNMYDPYSAYGPYGRHNREYTRHELHNLLSYCGFTNEISFTGNVHQDIPARAINMELLEKLLYATTHRQHDLGQYLFTRWRKRGACGAKKPRWLYRSYPETDMADD